MERSVGQLGVAGVVRLALVEPSAGQLGIAGVARLALVACSAGLCEASARQLGKRGLFLWSAAQGSSALQV